MHELLANYVDGISPDGFQFHPAIIAAITRADGALQLPTATYAGEQTPLDLREVERPCRESKTFEGTARVGSSWIWTAVRVYANRSRVELWAQKHHGGTQTPIATISRVHTTVWPGGAVLDDPPRSATALTGQGVTVRHWTYDFETGRDRHSGLPRPYESTIFAPADATQTGVWPYMGRGELLRHPDDGGLSTLGDARHQVYALGQHPGCFIKDGRPLIPEDYPGATLYGGTYMSGAHWINYGNADAPYKTDHVANNTLGERIVGADDEHMTTNFALCEAVAKWPDDEGFRHLLYMAASRYLMEVTTEQQQADRKMWWPAQARSRGRVVMTALRLAAALHVIGDMHYSRRLLDVAFSRLGTQWGMWQQSLKDGVSPLSHWANHRNARSPNEIGIQYAMLHEAEQVANYLKLPADPIRVMMAGTARYCFESFRLWDDVPGQSGWGVPYWTGKDRYGNEANSPTAPWFAWFAAVHSTSDASEAKKMAGIRALSETIPRRFR